MTSCPMCSTPLPSLILLGTLAIFLIRALTGEAAETWTNLDGRTLQATVMKADEAFVTFRLPNGKTARVALDQLIEGDRERITEWKTYSKYWKALPKGGGWPNRVTVNWFEAEVEVVKGQPAGKYLYRSPHFEFEADAKLAPNLVKDFSKIFEVTYHAVESNPLGLRLTEPLKKHFKVRLFKDARGYQKAGGVLGAAGVYSPKKKHILVPFYSLGLRQANKAWVRRGGYYDPTTLVHETVHQVLDHCLDVSPIWFNEGFADLVGAARYDSGQMLFDRHEDGIKKRLLGRDGYNPRVKKLGARGFEFPLAASEVLQMPRAYFMGFHPSPQIEHSQILHHYHSSLLLVHFLINEDLKGSKRLRQYLSAYQKAFIEGGGLEIELPDSVRTDEEKEALKKVMTRLTAIQRKASKAALPKVLEGRSEAAFFQAMQAFYKDKGIFLRQED